MKLILTACGYNNGWAFKEADEGKISALEAFLELKHRKLVDSIDEYKDIKPFEFLPGHRSLILGMKGQILAMEDKKKPKMKPKQKNASNERASENELKLQLIDHLSNYSIQKSLNIDWSNAITQFVVKEGEKADESFVHCSLQCPVCDTVRIVRYDKTWKISNMCKHIREQHIDELASTHEERNDTAILSSESVKKSNVRKQLNLNEERVEVLSVEVITDAVADDSLNNSIEDENDFIIYDPEYYSLNDEKQ